jgi:glutathione S-transferase
VGSLGGIVGLTLYGDLLLESPYVMSAYVALCEKGCPFEVRLLDLRAGAQRSPDFAGPTLTGKVPALEHDGFWLTESLAIVEYLEEVFPAPSVFPADVRERARARQIMGWLRSDLTALRAERPTESIFYRPTATPMSDAAQADARKLVRVATAVVGAGPGLSGRFTIADADLALALHRLIANGDPIPERLDRYARAVFARPSVRAYLDLPRPVVSG